MQVAVILATADDPPTVTELVDGELLGRHNEPLWGKMPDMVISSPIVEAKEVKFDGDPYVKPDDAFIYNRELDLSELARWAPEGWVLNSSVFVPNFRRARKSEHKRVSLPITINNVDGHAQRWFAFYTVSPRNKSSMRFHCYVTIRANLSTTVEVILSKRIVPRGGIYWGFVWEDHHVMEEYSIVEAGRMEWTEGVYGAYDVRTVFFHVSIADEIIVKVSPLSFFGRLGSCICTTGAFALLSFLLSWSIGGIGRSPGQLGGARAISLRSEPLEEELEADDDQASGRMLYPAL